MFELKRSSTLCSAGSHANVATRHINGVNIGMTSVYAPVEDNTQAPDPIQPQLSPGGEIDIGDGTHAEALGQEDNVAAALQTIIEAITSPVPAEPPAHLASQEQDLLGPDINDDVDEEEPREIPAGFAQV